MGVRLREVLMVVPTVLSLEAMCCFDAQGRIDIEMLIFNLIFKPVPGSRIQAGSYPGITRKGSRKLLGCLQGCTCHRPSCCSTATVGQEEQSVHGVSRIKSELSEVRTALYPELMDDMIYKSLEILRCMQEFWESNAACAKSVGTMKRIANHVVFGNCETLRLCYKIGPY